MSQLVLSLVLIMTLLQVGTPVSGTPEAGVLPDMPVLLGDQQRTGQMPGPAPDVTTSMSPSWSVPSGRGGQSAPLLVNDMLIVGGSDGVVRALDAGTGDEVWRQVLPGAVSSAQAADDGTLFVTVSGGALTALDVRSGKVVWSQPTGSGAPVSPLIMDDVVIVPAESRKLNGFARENGEPVWEIPLTSDIATELSTNGELVFAADGHGTVLAFTPDGRAAWSIVLDEAVVGAVVVAEETLIVAGTRGTVTAISIGDQAPLWSETIGRSAVTSPVIAGDVIVVGVDKSLVMLSRENGEMIREVVLAEPPGATPVVADGTIYMALGNRTMTAVDMETGEQVWSMPLGNGIPVPLVVSGGSIFTVDSRGTITRYIAD